ncbi:EndoU domain-containing protein [Pseudoclavibacter sp. 13-3]|uniref:EndoU domain-containing protein n=1 Tax=Pseudoclavibacter sp. 13-3 TaxID=2901228 RepID=UPI001E4EB9D0|nr:EndoU domain-containing protein [Pseudoclavibacter sp. 13-3]MCD7101618.1 EndoU domain-containing protein [Pseudoclavibacter sp. 13-3]
MTSRRGSRQRLTRNLTLLALVAVLAIWVFVQRGLDANDTTSPVVHDAGARTSASATPSAAAPKDTSLDASGAHAGSSGDIVGLSRLQGTDHFTRNALTHIFSGEISRAGKAVGYHSQAFTGTKGAVVSGTETAPDAQGVYTAQVTVDGRAKAGNRGFSTFYPTTMSAQQVVDAINEAYDGRSPQGDAFVGRGGGLTIQMALDDRGRIITAYPVQR